MKTNAVQTSFRDYSITWPVLPSVLHCSGCFLYVGIQTNHQGSWKAKSTYCTVRQDISHYMTSKFSDLVVPPGPGYQYGFRLGNNVMWRNNVIL
jgi:hypothetical protein